MRRSAYLFPATGCVRRALDATRIHDYLIKNGWSFTNNISAADLIVVSTCSVIGKSAEISLAGLNGVAKKASKDSMLVVTGCLPKVDPDKFEQISGPGSCAVIPTGELAKFDQLLKSAVKLADIPEANVITNEVGLFDYLLAYRVFPRHRWLVKLYKRMCTNRMFLRSIVFATDSINWAKRRLGMTARDPIVPYYNIRVAHGCALSCAYCCIKFATGHVRSRPIAEIVHEFKQGLAAGHKVFQLVCEDVGCYGIDIGSSFPELLRSLLAIEGGYQLVMIDFGGYWFVKYYDELLPLFKENQDKIRELYVALQSGSNKVLAAMNRPEKAEEVAARLKELKSELPQIVLRTTILVGFPGETEDDFRRSVDAVKNIGFEAVELNGYEDRPGTESSRMTNKVPQEVIDRRLRDIAEVVTVENGIGRGRRRN